jgi:type I restriction enzyme S subunit
LVRRRIRIYTINKEDLYITIAGTIGDVGIVPEVFDGMNLTENAAKIVFSSINKYWLQKVLSSQILQEQFIEKTKQLAQPKLALHRVESSFIPLCPIQEQERIVKKLDELTAICDLLKERIIRSAELKQLLSKTVVAFI